MDSHYFGTQHSGVQHKNGSRAVAVTRHASNKTSRSKYDKSVIQPTEEPTLHEEFLSLLQNTDNQEPKESKPLGLA